MGKRKQRQPNPLNTLAVVAAMTVGAVALVGGIKGLLDGLARRKEAEEAGETKRSFWDGVFQLGKDIWNGAATLVAGG